MKSPSSDPPPSIRLSKPRDLDAIREWMEEENARDVPDNFFSTDWHTVAEAHRGKKLLVYIDGKSGSPVAFQLGRLLSPGILQVRYDFRRGRSGIHIGAKMVEHCIKLNRENDECLLYIQCEPPSSVEFWEKMRFTAFSALDNGKTYAYRVLEKPLPLAAGGNVVSVAIRFYPWGTSTTPLSVHTPSAMLYPDGRVELGERVFFHKMLHPRELAIDLVVEADVDGQRRYRGRAKFLCASGVRQCTNGWYIDAILPENES